MCPMVQSGPMVSGKPMSVWQTQPSCTFEPSPDHDRLVVAAQHRVEPDRGARLEHHPPDQPRPRRHPEVPVRRQLRRDPVQRVEAHRSRSSNSRFSRRTSPISSGRRSRRSRSAGDDRLQLRLALREVLVDQHVVVLRPVADLVARLRHARRPPPRRCPGRARRSRLSSSAIDGGRMKIETTASRRRRVADLLAALPVDVEEHVLAAGDRRLHRRARRAVEVAEDLGVLEHLAGRRPSPRTRGGS